MAISTVSFGRIEYLKSGSQVRETPLPENWVLERQMSVYQEP